MVETFSCLWGPTKRTCFKKKFLAFHCRQNHKKSWTYQKRYWQTITFLCRRYDTCFDAANIILLRPSKLRQQLVYFKHLELIKIFICIKCKIYVDINITDFIENLNSQMMQWTRSHILEFKILFPLLCPIVNEVKKFLFVLCFLAHTRTVHSSTKDESPPVT